jgi:uncharacterized protein (DUF1330 family)
MDVDPTPERFAALLEAAASIEGPVQMVNLLRFAPDGGRESYLRYAATIAPHLERVGASITYAGNRREVVIGAEADGWWDAIALVRYPSRAAMIAMFTDPDYLAITEHRTAALVETHLIATEEWVV